MFSQVDRFVLVGILILFLSCLLGLFGLCQACKISNFRPSRKEPSAKEPTMFEDVNEYESYPISDPSQYLVYSNIQLPVETRPISYRQYPSPGDQGIEFDSGCGC